MYPPPPLPRVTLTLGSSELCVRFECREWIAVAIGVTTESCGLRCAIRAVLEEDCCVCRLVQD